MVFIYYLLHVRRSTYAVALYITPYNTQACIQHGTRGCTICYTWLGLTHHQTHQDQECSLYLKKEDIHSIQTILFAHMHLRRPVTVNSKDKNITSCTVEHWDLLNIISIQRPLIIQPLRIQPTSLYKAPSTGPLVP